MLQNRSFQGFMKTLKNKPIPDHIETAARQFTQMKHVRQIKAWIKVPGNMQAVNAKGQTLLHIAAVTGNKPLIEMCLKYVCANICTRYGDSALVLAIRGLGKQRKKERHFYIESIKALLDAGAVNAPPNHSKPKTAVSEAVRINDHEALILLLRAGFKLNEAEQSSIKSDESAMHPRLMNN